MVWCFATFGPCVAATDYKNFWNWFHCLSQLMFTLFSLQFKEFCISTHFRKGLGFVLMNVRVCDVHGNNNHRFLALIKHNCVKTKRLISFCKGAKCFCLSVRGSWRETTQWNLCHLQSVKRANMKFLPTATLILYVFQNNSNKCFYLHCFQINLFLEAALVYSYIYLFICNTYLQYIFTI